MTPRQVGNYSLDSLLGSGGMGEVYKAYDTHRGRYVALKLLPEAFSGDVEYLKRFQRESHVAARLTEPHVIPIHDFGEIDGQLFIDMRLVEGADIGARLAANGRIAPQEAVYLIGQVAEALDAAHADHLVHRDIKPSNILVTPSDFVYVVDFGIARSVGGPQTALTITGATIGTLHYMAPERFVDHDVDGRADVYSLACVLHECLTGAPPFRGKDLAALMYAQLYYGPPPASSLVEGIPPALDAVIARGMAKHPDDRFPTAGAMAAAAREALLAEAPAAPTVPPMPVQAPTWNDTPVPVWGAEPALGAWQSTANPPGPEADPAGNRSLKDTPTQTVLVDSAGHWGGTRAPENVPPQRLSPDPGGSYPPPGAAPGRPEREPARRRLGLLILAAAVILAIPIALVLILSGKSNTGITPPPLSASSPTSTGTARPTAAATSLAMPTSAGQIQIGQAPSYIQIAPNGKFAYIADLGSDSISVLNTSTDLVSGTIKIPQGPPQFVSFSPDSKTAYVSVYTTNGSVHLIAFVDTATGAVTATVPVNNFTPTESATSPDGRYLYVPNHNTVIGGANNDLLDVIDTVSKKLIGSIAVPANPHWVVFGKNGRFYTTDHMNATVTVLNAQTNSIITNIEVGETPHSEAISPDGSRLAVTSYDGNEVYLINTATDQEIAKIPVGKEPLDIAYSPDGRYLCTVNNLDNTVTVINTANNRVIGEIPTGKGPTSIAMLPNGHQAYVTNENAGTIEVLNFAQ
jgi:YVTN family beta-propeller protein